jgi:hypothetical protein
MPDYLDELWDALTEEEITGINARMGFVDDSNLTDIEAAFHRFK